MKIARNRLCVADPDTVRAFYCDTLGMERFEGAGAPIGYGADQCLLEFEGGADAPFYDVGDGFYWKIGITLQDLDAAVGFLRAEGWDVSEPRQFQEIGYMCHLRDPNGLPIELLQQSFQGRHTPFEGTSGHPVGAQATLAHVTLRISDLVAAKRICEERLGMRLMSVQAVALPERRFTLYFYAWSNEALPDPDLEAVANREWLWARPYTLLELQLLEEPVSGIRHRLAGEAGLSALGLADEDGRISYLDDGDLAAFR